MSKEHIEKYYPWADDGQSRCIQMIADLEGGFHHLTGKIKPYGQGVEYNTRYISLDTFDGNQLTIAVFMAHDRYIRFGVCPSGPGMLKLTLFPRQPEGGICTRHPSLSQAITEYRKYREEPNG